MPFSLLATGSDVVAVDLLLQASVPVHTRHGLAYWLACSHVCKITFSKKNSTPSKREPAPTHEHLMGREHFI